MDVANEDTLIFISVSQKSHTVKQHQQLCRRCSLEAIGYQSTFRKIHVHVW